MAGLAVDSAFGAASLREEHNAGGVSVAGSGLGGDGNEINAKRMSRGDLCSVLKPSHRHKILELEAGFMKASRLKEIVREDLEGEDGR